MESTERTGLGELLAFDAATGRGLRRLGDPLPEEPFRWSHLVAVAPDGSTAVMQVYAISPAPGAGGIPQFDYANENQFKTVRWDTQRNRKLGEWEVVGDRSEPARHYGPYTLTVGSLMPDPNNQNSKLPPAKLRCYSLTDGRLAHEWTTGFSMLEADRLQGAFLLTSGYDGQWVTRRQTMSYRPRTPIGYEVWELPAHDRVRVFDSDKQVSAVLGPAGRYVLRVRDDGAVEVIEPFALKKVVATVTMPARPEKFEFAPDGNRVAVSLADASVAIWDTARWRARIDEELAKAVPADLDKLWTDLTGDSTTGLRAARFLSAAGDKAVDLLKAKVTARSAPDEGQLKQLLADLDSPRFAVREKAEADLRDLSTQAEPHLRRALRAGPSAEMVKRVEAILAALATGKLSPAELREVRAVQALAWMDTPAARELLAEWAKGDPAAGLTRAARAAGR